MKNSVSRIPYEPCELEIINLACSDIVTASGGTLSNDGGLLYDDGGWT